MGITNDNKALVKQTAQIVQSYGTSDDVQAMSARIMAMHPAAKQIGPQGCMLLAQLGLALGLNPLPGTGHIHAWAEGNQLCVHIGVEGRMALARKDSPFSVYTRAMTAQEVDEHGLQPGDRGKVAEVTRLDIAQQMKELGVAIRPFVGVGIAKSNERPPKGRTLAWRAEQRAIKDALRLAYSLRLPNDLAAQVAVFESESGRAAQVIDQEDCAEPTIVPQKTPEQKEKDKADGRVLWGEPSAPQPDPGPAYTPALAPEDVQEGEVREAEPEAPQSQVADDLDALDLDALKETWKYIYKNAPANAKPQGIAQNATAEQWRVHIRAYRTKQAEVK